jgi:hypothetical protein
VVKYTHIILHIQALQDYIVHDFFLNMLRGHRKKTQTSDYVSNLLVETKSIQTINLLSIRTLFPCCIGKVDRLLYSCRSVKCQL